MIALPDEIWRMILRMAVASSVFKVPFSRILLVSPKIHDLRMVCRLFWRLLASTRAHATLSWKSLVLREPFGDELALNATDLHLQIHQDVTVWQSQVQFPRLMHLHITSASSTWIPIAPFRNIRCLTLNTFPKEPMSMSFPALKELTVTRAPLDFHITHVQFPELQVVRLRVKEKEELGILNTAWLHEFPTLTKLEVFSDLELDSCDVLNSLTKLQVLKLRGAGANKAFFHILEKAGGGLSLPHLTMLHLTSYVPTNPVPFMKLFAPHLKSLVVTFAKYFAFCQFPNLKSLRCAQFFTNEELLQVTWVATLEEVVILLPLSLQKLYKMPLLRKLRVGALTQELRIDTPICFRNLLMVHIVSGPLPDALSGSSHAMPALEDFAVSDNPRVPVFQWLAGSPRLKRLCITRFNTPCNTIQEMHANMKLVPEFQAPLLQQLNLPHVQVLPQYMYKLSILGVTFPNVRLLLFNNLWVTGEHARSQHAHMYAIMKNPTWCFLHL